MNVICRWVDWMNAQPPASLLLADGRRLALDVPVIAGILNVTPDSFSDGGVHLDVSAAVASGQAMSCAGARWLDVGGASTRPGALPVDARTQIQRVVPVIEQLSAVLSIPLSIDTTDQSVAEAAVNAGAVIVNDISAGRADSAMLGWLAERGLPVVLMHMQGTPRRMQADPKYDNVVSEVCRFLSERAEAAERAGVEHDRIVLDPGIGFGKTLEHNLQLLGHLDQVVALGYPVMLGASRKRMIGDLADAPNPIDRVPGTCAITAMAVAQGVQIHRVHDVPANLQAAQVAQAIAAAGRDYG